MAAGCPSSSQGSLERCRGRDFAQGHGHGRASARGAVREQTESACGAPEDRARDLESEGLAWARQGVPAAACSPSRSAPPAAARGSPAPPRARAPSENRGPPSGPAPAAPRGPRRTHRSLARLPPGPGPGPGRGRRRGPGPGRAARPVHGLRPRRVRLRQLAADSRPGPRTPRLAPVRQPGAARHWLRLPGPALEPLRPAPIGREARLSDASGRAGLPGAARRAVSALVARVGRGLWVLVGRLWGPGEEAAPWTAWTLPGISRALRETEIPRRSGSRPVADWGRVLRAQLEPRTGPLGPRSCSRVRPRAPGSPCAAQPTAGGRGAEGTARGPSLREDGAREVSTEDTRGAGAVENRSGCGEEGQGQVAPGGAPTAPGTPGSFGGVVGLSSNLTSRA